MSRITQITGWIEIDRRQFEENVKVIRDFPYDDDFPRMFQIPEEMGTKNPGYVVFGASMNFLNESKLFDSFEYLLECLFAFRAVVFSALEDERCSIRFYKYVMEESAWELLCADELAGLFFKRLFDFEGRPYDFV